MVKEGMSKTITTTTPTERQAREYAINVACFPIDETTTYSVIAGTMAIYGVLTTGDFSLHCWFTPTGDVYGEW